MMNDLLLVNELSKMLNDGWNAADWTQVQLIAPPLIIFQGRDSLTPPDITLSFARIRIQPTLSKQGSLGGIGSRKYVNTGLLTVQSFGTFSRADGFEVSQYMAIMAKRIYQGKVSPNGVLFRNCRTNDVGASGGWYQFNTLIEYQFDELE